MIINKVKLAVVLKKTKVIIFFDDYKNLPFTTMFWENEKTNGKYNNVYEEIKKYVNK